MTHTVNQSIRLRRTWLTPCSTRRRVSLSSTSRSCSALSAARWSASGCGSTVAVRHVSTPSSATSSVPISSSSPSHASCRYRTGGLANLSLIHLLPPPTRWRLCDRCACHAFCNAFCHYVIWHLVHLVAVIKCKINCFYDIEINCTLSNWNVCYHWFNTFK